ncbi:MAG: NUDIX domain-containing protein [Chloroflexi bacterium]|nr:NUDIX domain-containing protein [Chloroflexota bacterium]
MKLPMRRIAQFLQKAPWIVSSARWVWRLGQAKFTAGVVGVVFNEQGQVLLVEHVFHPYAPWGLPGGWVDRRESPAETVVRELQEELQLVATAGTLLLTEVDFGDHLDFSYICESNGNVGKLSSELLDYGWFDLESLPKLQRFHFRSIRRAQEVRANEQLARII